MTKTNETKTTKAKDDVAVPHQRSAAGLRVIDSLLEGLRLDLRMAAAHVQAGQVAEVQGIVRTLAGVLEAEAAEGKEGSS